jgi:hypothetical protein
MFGWFKSKEMVTVVPEVEPEINCYRWLPDSTAPDSFWRSDSELWQVPCSQSGSPDERDHAERYNKEYKC